MRSLVCLTVTLSCLGCAAVGPNGLPLLPTKEPVDPNAPTCVVEVRKGSGQPRVVKVPVVEEMSVQKAVDASNVRIGLSATEITVYRPSPAGDGRYVRMTSNWDERFRKVTVETDYAIHPGDRIVIAPEDSDILSELSSRLTSGLRPKLR